MAAQQRTEPTTSALLSGRPVVLFLIVVVSACVNAPKACRHAMNASGPCNKEPAQALLRPLHSTTPNSRHT